MISSFSQLSRGAALWLPVLVVGALLARAPAQCATQWLPGAGIPGTNGYIMATTMWDPDGGGPMQPVLVVGGTFTLAGTVLANNI
ncbi:MAG TPA: hypothetical protein VFD82_14865, partial [Planctomycetota bacterium]|nr:hypothetical protein [Planctomycetota bacterium]